LITDDSERVRQGLYSILELTDDMEVVGEAANGLEAIQQVERLRPDLVLMDLEMPIFDGLEATQRIKERFQSTGIVMFTIHSSDRNRERAIQAGVDAFIEKGGSTKTLIQMIRDVFNKLAAKK
jgi:DNA-binding NarL/FixJ family response regulator